jgi:hypothetical protein
MSSAFGNKVLPPLPAAARGGWGLGPILSLSFSDVHVLCSALLTSCMSFVFQVWLAVVQVFIRLFLNNQAVGSLDWFSS